MAGQEAQPQLVPLESNPEVMTKYLGRLGVPTARCRLVDVMGLEGEALAWVPRPVYALLLLFPCSAAYERHKSAQESDLRAAGQKLAPGLFYLKQSLSNACGTVALVHAVANNEDRLELGSGWLGRFVPEARELDPAARGALLESSPELLEAHAELASEGQTREPSAHDRVDYHFIAFVHKDGDLYELDGRKAFPVNHGPTTPDDLLEDAARVCREFMARDPDEVHFTVVALVGGED